MTTYFDVGANDGEWGIARAIEDPNCTVYAFEPTPNLCEKIKSTVTSLRLTNYVLVQAAVSDIPGKRTFHLSPQGDWGCSSLKEFKDRNDPDFRDNWGHCWGIKHDGDIEVDVVRLDDFCRELGITSVDYMHCDAQGSDLDVLKSFGDDIRMLMGGVIEAASDIRHAIYTEQHTVEDSKAWLLDHGFKNIVVWKNDDLGNELNIGFARQMNTLLFIFHNTLTEKHLEMSISSILIRQNNRVRWDNVLVHNTHDTIATDKIVELFKKEKDIIGNVAVIEPQGQKGSLHQDLQTCFTYIKDNIHHGFICVLKGDYAVSTNFGEVYLDATKVMPSNAQWSLPIYNAKEFVDDWDILEKLEQPYFSLVSEDTYYRCGTNLQHTPEGEVLSLKGKRDDDPSVKFVAHNVLPDYNLHVFGIEAAKKVTELYHLMPIDAGWNCVGFMFKGLFSKGVTYYSATRAFGVHVFHATDRGDPRKMIPGQRY